jgi:hypothetical protein
MTDPATQSTAPRTIPDTATAFGLGWHIAELYHYERLPGETEPGGLDTLPGLGRLPRIDRAYLLVNQVTVALGRIGCREVSLETIHQHLHTDPIRLRELKKAVREVHVALQKTLTARDARLGKAYGLGRSLAETMLVPTTQAPQTFTAQFDHYRVRTMQAQLADLRGVLPRYSASAVECTLDAWVHWVATAVPAGASPAWTAATKRDVGQRLRRQGELWYGLLSGDTDPIQLLRQQDYVKAAESMTASIGKLAWSFLLTTWIGRILGALVITFVLLVLRIALIGALPVLLGTIAALLGALGLTAGGVASAVRRVLDQAQAPLWEAELTQGIGAAALCLPDARRAVLEEAPAEQGAASDECPSPAEQNLVS